MKQYNELIKIVEEGPISYDEERKTEFKKKSLSFLRKLAKDLGLIEKKIWFNPSGIAVSGDCTLIGMWSENKGIYVNLDDDTFLYRTVSHMQDYSGCTNNFIYSSWHKNYKQSYEEVIDSILKLNK